MTPGAADLRHLAALTDRFGTFEHAMGAEPRREHGYCTDDVARLLVVAARDPDQGPEARALADSAYRFVTDAQGVTGKTRNRRDARGHWHGHRSVEDCWGRSLWAFGVVAQHRSDWMASGALAHFERGAERRSPWVRSMAHAALGAAAVLEVLPHHEGARRLLADAAHLIGAPGGDDLWPWPEPRLTYANAVLPDVLVAAGVALERPQLLEHGLLLLEWLLDLQTVGGHLSVTPAGGAGPGDQPGFDQQPIEVATLADTCARAFAVTGDPHWEIGVRMAGAWFDGDNDVGVPMWDERTGGAYDGLHDRGPNLNQGAESAIALVSTRQRQRALDRVAT
jgi:hypothetical protein